MLLQVNIINFALIEELSISFGKGFNVLTGETGAGKSILIDAINYVLGGKFNKDLIRTGENRTYVEAVFTVENSKTTERLNSLGIEFEDLLIISRETFQSGKSIAKINGRSMLLSQIKFISETLIDIHGQHENQTLLDSSSHLDFLDSFGEDIYGTSLKEFLEYYLKLNEIKNKINEIKGKNGDRQKVLDYLKYQIEEIDGAKLKINEDDELTKQYSIISNAEKINNVLGNSYEALYNGNDEKTSVYDTIGSIVKELRTIEKNLPAVKKIADSMEESYYNLEENIEEIREIKDSVIYDENELQTINERLYLINNYKKKYGKTIEEILNYRDSIKIQYEEINNSEEILKELTIKKENIQFELNKIASILHNQRVKLSLELETKVKHELSFIGLKNCNFKIEVTNSENINQNGFDKVQFLISTNTGEPLKPLEKVVSGGELSRIMLALKTVFVDKDKIPSVIFDEIDTGISGRIAQCVGEKMFTISIKHQVFCVTHLPQIASISENHYLISKETKGNKTYTNVKELNKEGKAEEIARMISGAEVTKLTLENSKELIKLSEEKKKEIYNKK